MNLPQLIPYLESYTKIEYDTVGWSEFTVKAVKGSYKAADWLERAGSGIAAGAYGPHVLGDPEVCVEHLLTNALVDRPPFGDRLELVQCLRTSGYLSPTFRLPRDGYCADRSDYDARWSRSPQFGLFAPYSSQHDRDCLVYDAALWCFEHWRREEFQNALARVSGDILAYNSLDAVGGMLFLIFAWSEHSIWGALLDRTK